MPTLNKSRSKHLLKFNKKSLSKAIQLITNFNNGNYHTQNKKLDNGDFTKMVCRVCKRGRETGWHLLTDCHSIRDKVERIFTTDGDWTVKELREFLSLEEVCSMLDHRLDTAPD